MFFFLNPEFPAKTESCAIRGFCDGFTCSDVGPGQLDYLLLTPTLGIIIHDLTKTLHVSPGLLYCEKQGTKAK